MVSYCFYTLVFRILSMTARIGRGGALIVALLAASELAVAAPHVPKHDSVVLETLPGKPGDPAGVELRRLRAVAARNPADAALAAALARRYFERAMAQGDPRYLGYAQAALRAWPDNAAASAEILLLHGMLRQARHDFAGGIRALEQALKADPANIEAHAWLAAIRMVQADYPAARRECELLAENATELQATACTAYVDATTGRARAAYARLNEALARRAGVEPGFAVWIQTRLAEMAWRYGDPALAERHFRRGLALGIDDNFLLAAYADFLLERGRPAEVMTLLRDWARSDTLLLRLALAARRLKLAEGEKYVRTLGERFADAALRGEKLHLQEESRYLLELEGDARAALAAARDNYRTQREPRDALTLIEAALAARDPAAAAPAIEWLESSRYEGARLRDAASNLKALKP